MIWQNQGLQHISQIGKFIIVVQEETDGQFSIKLESIKSKKRFKELDNAKDFAIVFSKLLFREALKESND